MTEPVATVGSTVSGSGDVSDGTMVTGNQSKVYVHGKAVCTVGDLASNSGRVIEGTAKFQINGLPVARVTDKLDYGGEITSGDDSVRIS